MDDVLQEMRKPRIAILSATILGVAIMAHLAFWAFAGVKTEFDGGDASDRDHDEILNLLHDQWNLAAVENVSDLVALFDNERITKISFRPSIVHFAEEAPQLGLVIRVWSGDGRSDKKRSFMFLRGANDKPLMRELMTT